MSSNKGFLFDNELVIERHEKILDSEIDSTRLSGRTFKGVTKSSTAAVIANTVRKTLSDKCIPYVYTDSGDLSMGVIYTYNYSRYSKADGVVTRNFTFTSMEDATNSPKLHILIITVTYNDSDPGTLLTSNKAEKTVTLEYDV